MVAALTLLGCLCVASPASANLLINGSFEDSLLVPNSTFTNGLFTQTNNGDIIGWTTQNGGNWYFNNGTQFGTAQDGVRFVEFDPANVGSLAPISQSFAVTANTPYNVSFWAGIRPDMGPGDVIRAAITLAAGDGAASFAATDLTLIGNGATPAGWQQFSFGFTPTANTTATLTFSHDSEYGCLDGVSVTASATPEPSSLVLLAAGLIGFAAYAWRKRK